MCSDGMGGGVSKNVVGTNGLTFITLLEIATIRSHSEFSELV